MAEAAIRIEGVDPSIDGEYPIDAGALTNRDYNDIKRIANLRATEVTEAFEHGDMDLFVAFAAIALRHAGKPFNVDALWDSPVGKITFVGGAAEEVDDLPPSIAPPSESQNERDGDRRRSEEIAPSGLRSVNVSDDRGSDPSHIGSQPSVTGAMSPSETLAS